MKTTKSVDSIPAYYVTTTLPYVNAPLHLGHATEIIRADAIARYRRLAGHDVYFNTGTDEHGLKIYEAAEKTGRNAQEFVNEYAELFKNTLDKFGVSKDTHYIRTTDKKHIIAAQEFWKICDKNGYIYKKKYQTKYCVGCEEEKTDSELPHGKCPIHDRIPETIDEENYFFKLSLFSERLREFYNKRPDFITPSHRLNELREFISRGLKDFSISRVKEKMPWGIPVPGDSSQVMYVWFDALINYISTLGWPADEKNFERYWVNGTPTQYCGKDNTRFQGLMWQAMLMAAGLPESYKIVVDGFITGDGGVKMSKTLGNVVDPIEIINEYGTDALRYFVLREFHPFEDTAVSKEKMKEWYNANLANGLGNLASRIMKMADAHSVVLDDESRKKAANSDAVAALYEKQKVAILNYDIQSAMEAIWEFIGITDKFVQERAPFKKIKTNKEEAVADIKILLGHVEVIAVALEPFLPNSSVRLKEAVFSGKAITSPLFPRKE